jgi:hypothetical protein
MGRGGGGGGLLKIFDKMFKVYNQYAPHLHKV